MSDSSEKESKSERNYIVSAIGGAFFIWIVNFFWPGVIPFATFSFWKTHGSVGDWLMAARPIFAWALVVNVLIELNYAFKLTAMSRRDRDIYQLLEDGALVQFLRGLVFSAFAGLVEEICFRWLIFLSAIASIKLVNYLFFGWLGFGIAEWLHLNLFGPIADWTTFHHLHAYLFAPTTWAVGAALIYANAFFRDGHKYQGPLGYVNSWFLGMFFFWTMFTYGLPAAILVHFLYDVVCFTVSPVALVIRRIWFGVSDHMTDD